jgi:glycine/D-amino acid oxidase-like deaminating enzyme
LLALATTDHEDLRTESLPWSSIPDLRSGPAPRAFTCDVLVVGGGITGALIAEHLSALGHDVALIDQEPPGRGSTAASTAMLQWEIDAPLLELADLHGFERAADVYRRSLKAVEGLSELIAALALPCRHRPRSTLYLAAGEAGFSELAREHELRRQAGLPGELLTAGDLRRHFGFDRPGAIWSPGSADADPVCLTEGLLRVARSRGARLLAAEALGVDSDAGGVTVALAGGGEARARHVVLATGYAMPHVLPQDLHKVSTSWALLTERQDPGVLWRDEALLWEASAGYSYARTTADGRIVFGGEDESWHDADKAAALLPEKTETLLRKLADLRPGARLGVSAAWAGAFGETLDGLPLIGRVPGQPRVLAAYGYGGNGITFSFMASRLLGALIQGEERPWFEAFALDRRVQA